MELTDNDYLSIFDLELNKYAREHKDKKILAIVCRKAKMILEDSVNCISIKEKDGIHYLWRGIVEILLEDNELGFTDNEFYFITKDEYEEVKNARK